MDDLTGTLIRFEKLRHYSVMMFVLEDAGISARGAILETICTRRPLFLALSKGLRTDLEEVAGHEIYLDFSLFAGEAAKSRFRMASSLASGSITSLTRRLMCRSCNMLILSHHREDWYTRL